MPKRRYDGPNRNGGNSNNNNKSNDLFSGLLAKHSKHKRRRRDPKQRKKMLEKEQRKQNNNDEEKYATPQVKQLRQLRKEKTLLLQSSISSSSSSSKNSKPTIALCFLVVEDIPHEKIWREWIRQSNNNNSKYNVNVYIHAKFPEKLKTKWAKRHLIRDNNGQIINFKPNWGAIEVTRALLKLFEIALIDIDVERLCYVSESCIPICSFENASKLLFETEKSWLKAYQTPVDGYDTMMMNAVNRNAIPKECVYKCDTWVMLTRKHAQACIIDLPNLLKSPVWPHFSKVKVADEICLPTLMAVIGAIDSEKEPENGGGDGIIRRKVTYVDWSEGGAHPKAFTSLTQDVIDKGYIEGKAIFARKFKEGTVDLKTWLTFCNDGIKLTIEDVQAVEADIEESSTTNTTTTTTRSSVVDSTVTTTTINNNNNNNNNNVLNNKKRNNLIIVCAGDNSLHHDHNWYTTTSREFDVCVIYYGNDQTVENRYKTESTYFIKRQGPKWQLIRHALKSSNEILPWKKYEYIWMPDDDLSIRVDSINEFFHIAKKYKLNLCQPSLVDLNVEHKILIQRPSNILRFTNFVEIMAPCLHVDALQHVWKTLDADRIKSGWCLDLVWPHLLNYNGVAVIDKTPMIHTRPVTAFNPDGFFYQKYKIDPRNEGHKTLQIYNVQSRKPEVLGVISL